MNWRAAWRRVDLTRPLAILLTCVAIAGCTGSVELLSEVPEAEANDVLSALESANLKAQKIAGKEGMVKLMIDSSQVAEAVRVLNAEGLPRPRYATMGEVFRKEGLISSPLEERARYLWALSQELSATVAQIDGVVRARVHVVLPERASSGEPMMPSSAAVFIKHQAGYDLQGAIAQIKQLVSNSIPGLSSDKVSVVLVAAQARPAGVKTVSATAGGVAPAAAGTAPQRKRPDAMLIAAGVTLLVALIAGGFVGVGVWRRKRAGRAVEPVVATSAPRIENASS